MFTWIKQKYKNDLQLFIETIHKKGNYSFDFLTVSNAYILIDQYPIVKDDTVSIRQTIVNLYRQRAELIECLTQANISISQTGALRDNINHGKEYTAVRLDTWLVDTENCRVNYYVFINELRELVEEHIQLLLERKETSSSVKFSALGYSLYTLHCDLLALAEAHLLFVHENQPK